MNNEQDWQPARIATREHILKSHTIDPGEVSKFAGEIVRVRRVESTPEFEAMMLQKLMHLGCTGEGFEVHRDDVRRLWPEMIAVNVSLCDCELLMD